MLRWAYSFKFISLYLLIRLQKRPPSYVERGVRQVLKLKFVFKTDAQVKYEANKKKLTM